MDETQKHYVEVKKQDAKHYMLYYFIYVKSNKRQNEFTMIEIRTVVSCEEWRSTGIEHETILLK